MKIRLRILTDAEVLESHSARGLPIITVAVAGTRWSGNQAMLEQWNEHSGQFEPVEITL